MPIKKKNVKTSTATHARRSPTRPRSSPHRLEQLTRLSDMTLSVLAPLAENCMGADREVIFEIVCV